MNASRRQRVEMHVVGRGRVRGGVAAEFSLHVELEWEQKAAEGFAAPHTHCECFRSSAGGADWDGVEQTNACEQGELCPQMVNVTVDERVIVQARGDAIRSGIQQL